MNIKTLFVVFFGAIVATILGGCVTGPVYQPLTIRDLVVLPDVRISKTLYSDAPPDTAPTELQTELAVDLGASRMSGSDSDPLNVGQARIGDITFSAPQTLKTKFDFAVYDVSARWRRFSQEPIVGFEVFGGLGYADLDLSVSSPTTEATESISSPAFRMGVGGMLRILHSTHLHATGTVLATKSNLSNVTHLQILAARALGRHATINAGYSTWHVDATRAGRSRISLGFSGPSIGLALGF